MGRAKIVVMHKRVVVIVISSLLILVAAASYLLVWHGKQNDSASNINSSSINDAVYQPAIDMQEAYKALQDGDTEAAAKKALATVESAKDDLDILLAAADVVSYQDKDQAKALYAEALKLYSTANNPEDDNKPMRVYWAAARLAEQAGECTSAAGYYEKAIKAASLDDPEEQDIATRSKVELDKLKCLE